MDLPSAHRRPKFRLEEAEKRDVLKISVGFLISFLVLIIVWVVIKVDMYNPETVLPLGDCNTEFYTPSPDEVTPAPTKPDEKVTPAPTKPDEKVTPAPTKPDETTGTKNATDAPTPAPLPPPAFPTSIPFSKHTSCLRAFSSFTLQRDSLPIQFKLRFTPKDGRTDSILLEFYKILVTNIQVSGLVAPDVKARITCQKGECKMPRDIAYIVNRDVAEITMVDFLLDTSKTNTYIDHVISKLSVVSISTNPDFEFNELIIRYFFLIVATAVAARFYFTIAFGRLRYPWPAWALEQKWTFILLVLLIGFNNPFCWAKRYADPATKGFWLFIDVSLRYTFLLGYLLAVISMIDHISQSKRKSTKEFYIPKLALLAPLWLVLVVRSLQTMNTQEPALRKPLVIGFVSVVMTIYILWLIYMIAAMLNKVAHAPAGQTVHVGVRFKLVWTLNLVMIVAIAAALYRVNAWGVESTEFIFGYAGFNFYVFILAALFAPAATSMPYRPPQQPNPDAEVVINDEYEVEGDY